MIVHVVGNRPQFIKLAPLYREFKSRGYQQSIIHSGQHYDENMSDVFFEELKIPKPYANLNVGSGTHAETTARAMLALEQELLKMSPQLIILYGDTNTTVAGALVAAKLNIPYAHVEGGTRANNKQNPEECNRIVTDHLASIIFCSDNASMKQAEREGLSKVSYVTGDIMYDTYLSVDSQQKADEDNIILMTWHRQENTSSRERMESIINFVKELDGEIICPLHPRTEGCLKKFGLWDEVKGIKQLKIISPIGYFEMVSLMKRARLIVTDSGGVSKESSFAGAKCIFFADLDIWSELQEQKWILKINPENDRDTKRAIEFAQKAEKVEMENCPKCFGDGRAAKKMVDLLEQFSYI